VLILLDNNVPRGLARALTGHVVAEAREQGWATLKNGALLNVAEEAGFDVLVTADKDIRYQQNLEGRKIAIVVLTQLRWGLVRRMSTEIAAAVNAATPGSFAEVEIPFQ
jgi:predicted nuclease of predicted toxin-antitoxin system